VINDTEKAKWRGKLQEMKKAWLENDKKAAKCCSFKAINAVLAIIELLFQSEKSREGRQSLRILSGVNLYLKKVIGVYRKTEFQSDKCRACYYRWCDSR